MRQLDSRLVWGERANHLQSTTQYAAQDIGVPELVLCAAIVGELDKVCKRVLFEDQGELLVVGRPIRYSRGGVEEYLETDLESPCQHIHLPGSRYAG